jgi:hypothetical protein
MSVMRLTDIRLDPELQAVQRSIVRDLPRTRARKRVGRCYEIALHAQNELPPETRWQLVHGLVSGPDATRHGHAWLMRDEWVWDPVQDKFYSKAWYLEAGRAEIVAQYSRSEAAKNFLRNHSYGPWEDVLLARGAAIEDLKHTIRNISRVLFAHQELNQELHDLAVEFESVASPFIGGNLSVAGLETVLKVIAELEYTPWRIPTVVEDLYKVWPLIRMG